MGKTNEQNLQMNLAHLQNLIKRDPQSYHDEFIQQLRRWHSLKQIFHLKPSEESKDLMDLANFLSHVSLCFKKEMGEFPDQIHELLEKNYNVMVPIVRRTMVQCLILLRNKDMIPSTKVLELFFQLFRCKDKQLRNLLYSHIVTDIKNSNAKHKNNKLNSTLQTYMYTMIHDSDEVAAKKSLEVMAELYRKGVWNDAKTVNIIATACLSPNTKLLTAALNFFLSGDQAETEPSDDEEDAQTSYQSMVHAHKHARKTSRRATLMKKALTKMKKKENKKSKEIVNFPAIQLLNDPQGLAEKMFSKLRKSNEKFEVRLTVMNFISRLVSVHQLLLLDFYSYLQKYYQPHQQDVTQILAITAQACHVYVPPEVVDPPVRAIAHNFVSDHCSAEAMTVGLNAIREICARCPLALDETLLQDLTQYKEHRNKGVMMAARSLISLYREVNPHLLHKKDRGKDAQENLASAVRPKYGEIRAAEVIEGTELLQQLESKKRKREEEGEEDGEDGWEEWEEASMDSDDEDEEGFEEVGSDEEIEVSGDEDENESDDDEDEEGDDDEDEEGDDDDDDQDEEGEEGEEDDDEDEGEEDEEGEEGEEAEEEMETEEKPAPVPVAEEKPKFKGVQMSRRERRRLEREAKAQKKANPVQPAPMPQVVKENRIEMTRILTQEDFEKLRKLKTLKQTKKAEGDAEEIELSDIENSSEEEDEEEEENGPTDVLDPQALFKHTKSKKQSYEERMASIENGRVGREKFGAKREKERGSKTNEEKKKTKNYGMIKYKREVRMKAKRSFREKQYYERKSIQKAKKAKLK